jgi:hypothetical protein
MVQTGNNTKMKRQQTQRKDNNTTNTHKTQITDSCCCSTNTQMCRWLPNPYVLRKQNTMMSLLFLKHTDSVARLVLSVTLFIPISINRYSNIEREQITYSIQTCITNEQAPGYVGSTKR